MAAVPWPPCLCPVPAHSPQWNSRKNALFLSVNFLRELSSTWARFDLGARPSRIKGDADAGRVPDLQHQAHFRSWQGVRGSHGTRDLHRLRHTDRCFHRNAALPAPDRSANAGTRTRCLGAELGESDAREPARLLCSLCWRAAATAAATFGGAEVRGAVPARSVRPQNCQPHRKTSDRRGASTR